MSQYHGTGMGRKPRDRDADFSRCIPVPCVQELTVMLSRPAKFSIAVSLCLFFSSNAVSAQQVAPMPDPTYGGGSYTSFQSPTDLPMPQEDDLTNPNTVTIPIPGGGNITVDGPNA